MSALFETLKGKLNTVEIDGIKLYIAEGDTLLTEAQLEVYADLREAEIAAQEAAKRADKAGMGMARMGHIAPRGLIAQTRDGQVVKWKKDKVLSWRVAKASFRGNAAHYQLVVDSMKAATAEWESACGVNFEYHPELDSKPGTGLEGMVFVVREFNAGGKFIAAAFFPSDPVARRNVNIDPSYYTTTFDKVGVLRHELGHVLGFRHEHIRNDAPPVCPNEQLWDTQVLTSYDPQSVMHYFCGGAGSHNLAITDLDRKGAQQVYGLPLASQAQVDPGG
jgi:Astacin (Peptidase family M12A)